MKSDLPYIQHMLQAIEEIRGLREWDAKEPYITRVLEREFSIIGEAAGKLSALRRERHAAIPWTKIIGLRHIIVHGYDRVSAKELWEIADTQLEALEATLRTMRKEIEDE